MYFDNFILLLFYFIYFIGVWSQEIYSRGEKRVWYFKEAPESTLKPKHRNSMRQEQEMLTMNKRRRSASLPIYVHISPILDKRSRRENEDAVMTISESNEIILFALGLSNQEARLDAVELRWMTIK